MPTGAGDGARLARHRHADLAADAAALLDHLGVGQAYLYGSSFGATVVLAALAEWPGRFPRAVLQGAFARRDLALTEVRSALVLRHWRNPARRLPFHDAVQRLLHGGFFRDSPAGAWRFFLDCLGEVPLAAQAHRALALRDLDLRPTLPAIRQPVLLVRGEDDPVVNAAAAEELCRGLPNAALVELPGCGHHPEFTRPAVLADAVRQFLTPPPCAAG
jgi:pimeloyl-ACP methyl ester carboxylesterase